VGNIPGRWMVQQHPEWYTAYIGIGQMVCPATDDRLQYGLTLDRARKRGETKVVRKLERNGPTPYLGDAVEVARKYGNITFPNLRYMCADMLAAGGRPADGDIKAMINVKEHHLSTRLVPLLESHSP
jgi:hypothetical protein